MAYIWPSVGSVVPLSPSFFLLSFNPVLNCLFWLSPMAYHICHCWRILINLCHWKAVLHADYLSSHICSDWKSWPPGAWSIEGYNTCEWCRHSTITATSLTLKGIIPMAVWSIHLLYRASIVILSTVLLACHRPIKSLSILHWFLVSLDWDSLACVL